MKGGVIRKRVGIDTAGAGQIGGERDGAVGEVLTRAVPLGHGNVDRDRAEGHHVIPLEVGYRDVVRALALLRAVFIDFVEEDGVVRHDHSAFNLKDLPSISGGVERAEETITTETLRAHRGAPQPKPNSRAAETPETSLPPLQTTNPRHISRAV